MTTGKDPAKTSTGSENGGDAPQKVTFSEEQQAKVQEIIDEAVGRTATKLRQEHETQLSQLRSELQQAQEQAKNATTAAGKEKAKDNAEALQSQIEEMRRASEGTKQEAERFRTLAQQKEQEVAQARQETLNIRREVAMARSAATQNFVNVDVVMKLTAESIKWDEGKNSFTVVGENGQPRLNSAFEPMTLDEFYQEFAAKNPYLVRGDVKTGAGSSDGKRFDVTTNGKYELTQIFGSKSDGNLALKLKKENPQEYARLKKMAQEQRIIA